MRFLADVQVDVQAQQETVVTQFQSLHSGPRLEVDRLCAGGVLVVARKAWRSGDTSVSSPALYEEWAAWHEEARNS